MTNTNLASDNDSYKTDPYEVLPKGETIKEELQSNIDKSKYIIKQSAYNVQPKGEIGKRYEPLPIEIDQAIMLEDLSAVEYHNFNLMSSSKIREVIKDPLRFKYYLDNSDECISSKSLKTGRLLHEIVLEGKHNFEVSKKTKTSTKEDICGWLEARHIDYMTKITEHPAVNRLLENTKKEISILFNLYGMETKARLDALKIIMHNQVMAR